MNGIWIFIKQFVERLQTESPKFFKTLRWISLVLAILLSGMIIVDQNYPFGLQNIIFGTLTWRAIIINITSGIIFVFGFTFLPVQDSKKLKSNGEAGSNGAEH